jgi:hypothetical protein
MRRVVVLLSILTIVLTGCLPRTFVKKDPGPHDRGIRYYRPKPYLMVKPLITRVEKDGPGLLQAGFVSIETVTLPDFSEEYSIHIRSGLGINETSITLEDGWNLTALNAKLDSQFDENVSAIGDVVSAARGGNERAKMDLDAPQLTVRALDVPMGLYEAVISRDSHGQKRLYGFRYVGFFPFSSCPIESCGVTQEHCQSTALYGIVYDKTYGAMVFKELGELTQPQEHERPTAARANPLRAEDVQTGSDPAKPSLGAGESTGSRRAPSEAESIKAPKGVIRGAAE